MEIKLIDLVLNHIDAALDVDELMNFGDFVRWVLKHEEVKEKELNDVLRSLHKNLLNAYHTELDFIRRIRLRSAIIHFEADFSDYLIEKETKSLASHKN